MLIIITVLTFILSASVVFYLQRAFSPFFSTKGAVYPSLGQRPMLRNRLTMKTEGPIYRAVASMTIALINYVLAMGLCG